MFTLSIKKCEICGKDFMPTNPRQKYCKDIHYRKCPICGKEYEEPNLDKFKQPPTTCSMECRVKKRTITSIEKYGINAPGNNPNAREKAKQTMRERYGVDYAQESKEIKDKSIKTWISKYGVDNPQKDNRVKAKTANTNLERYGSTSYLTSDCGKPVIESIMMNKYGTTVPLRNSDIKEHWKSTNLEKYGSISPLQNEDIKEQMKENSIIKYGTEYPQSSEIVKQHIKDTFIRNYGVDNCFKSKDIIEKIHRSFFNKYGVHGVMEVPHIAQKIIATNMKKYGVPYGIMVNKARISSGAISKINRAMQKKLNDVGFDTSTEYVIQNRIYDIRIYPGNTLIEIDPSYTHNSIGNHWSGEGKSKYYHLEKTLIALKNGYRCMHLWDWDCQSKFINSLINKHTIYTDSSPIILTPEDASDFIQQYGLYNVTENIHNVIFIGIQYKTKLMSLIGFKQIDSLMNIWELICIESRFGYTVYNGNQLILDEFIRLYDPNKIVSYADFSKTNGDSLDALGFKYIKFIMPTKIWSKGRHAIIDDGNIIPEAMIADRWFPVYNCGYKMYEKYIRQPEILNEY